MLSSKFKVLAAILYTVTITYLSLAVIEVPKVSQKLFENQDKLVHFIFYFLFTILWFVAIKHKITTIKKLIIITSFAVFYGILMELCQGLFTNYRSPDKRDIVANTLGAIFATVVIIQFQFKKT